MIKEFQGTYRWLSNFWPTEIKYKDLLFSSVEHIFLSAKNNSNEWKDFCINEKKPKTVKKKSYNIELVSNWENIKINIMFKIVTTKFENNELRKKLFKKNKTYIQEGNNWNDTF
jgi:predicted NAD-dependent protein-ADP-ribosyltransferase YbiA (DUF1768 family)